MGGNTTQVPVPQQVGSEVKNNPQFPQPPSNLNQPKKPKKSRNKILQIADWIIPGHGKMFQNPRKK